MNLTREQIVVLRTLTERGSMTVNQLVHNRTPEKRELYRAATHSLHGAGLIEGRYEGKYLTRKYNITEAGRSMLGAQYAGE